MMDEFLSETYVEIFKSWILGHKKLKMSISDDRSSITIKNYYSESHVNFYQMNIVEFTIKNIEKDETVFYLHFQIKNLRQAVDLFNEMLETINNITNTPALKVLFTCTSGLTTGYFAQKVNEVADLLHLDIHVDAVSYNNLYKAGHDYDIIMLAPQISYMDTKVRAILKEQVIVKIPSPIFAKYDIKKMLALIEQNRNNKAVLDEHHEPIKAKNLRPSNVKTLCIALIRNSRRVHIAYRIYDEQNQILENDEIIKPRLTIFDYYLVIDSMLGQYPDIGIIGISTPGIINKGHITSLNLFGIEEVFIERDFTSKYSQKFVFLNDVNAIALGYYGSQDEYNSISFIFQPVASKSGTGHIINDRLILGNHNIAGEVQYLPANYSKDVLELHQTPEGAIEAMAKTIISIVSIIDPQLVVFCCTLITDLDELNKEIEKDLPTQYIPKIIKIEYLQEYMLLGTLLDCQQN